MSESEQTTECATYDTVNPWGLAFGLPNAGKLALASWGVSLRSAWAIGSAAAAYCLIPTTAIVLSFFGEPYLTLGSYVGRMLIATVLLSGVAVAVIFCVWLLITFLTAFVSLKQSTEAGLRAFMMAPLVFVVPTTVWTGFFFCSMLGDAVVDTAAGKPEWLASMPIRLLGSLWWPGLGAMCVYWFGLAAARRAPGMSLLLKEPRCPNCGYIILGLTEPRCPECGTPF